MSEAARPEGALPETGGLAPPSTLLLLAETRALLEVGFGLATAPLLRLAAKGDGHAVLILPGFLASDRSTGHLRDVLGKLGHAALGWELGRNLGGIGRLRHTLQQRLTRLHHETGRRVSLVGWSLGGVLARDLALHMPDKVRRVITLGSPFNGDLSANNVHRLYEQLSGEQITVRPMLDAAARLAADLGVPATAIYSRTDGIVNWRTCVLTPNHHAENIEILGASHMALGFNAAAVWAVADRLAQPEGAFHRFRRRGPFAAGYGKIS
jgi:pimeloyl-ACP methyl ester carboxylesterase